MISANDLTANVEGTAIANGLMTAALFDLLIKKGVFTRDEAWGQLRSAAGMLGNDFSGRPAPFNALRVINQVMANLAKDSQ